MYRTDDPVADFLAHDAERQRRLRRRPRCCECGEHIQDEYAYCINDEWICEACLNGHYRQSVEDFVE